MKVGVGDIADTIVPSGAQGSSAITRADKTLRKMFWRMKISTMREPLRLSYSKTTDRPVARKGPVGENVQAPYRVARHMSSLWSS